MHSDVGLVSNRTVGRNLGPLYVVTGIWMVAMETKKKWCRGIIKP